MINLVDASVGEDADLCASTSCKKKTKKKKNLVIPIIASIGEFYVLVVNHNV